MPLLEIKLHLPTEAQASPLECFSLLYICSWFKLPGLPHPVWPFFLLWLIKTKLLNKPVRVFWRKCVFFPMDAFLAT